MATQHKIDGTSINHVSQASWVQPNVDQSLNAIELHSRKQTHIWLADIMPMATWQTLIGKRGSLVSLITTDPDNANGDYVTYYGVVVREVTKGAHDSRNARGVRCEFLVKV